RRGGGRRDGMGRDGRSPAWPPALTLPTSTSASSAMRLPSIAPSPVVSDDDPTLTTTRVAAATSARLPVMAPATSWGEPPVGAARPESVRRAGRDVGVPVEHDGARPVPHHDPAA